MTSLNRPSTADYAAAFRAGECTPSDVAEAALAALAASEAHDPPLNAFVAVDRGRVLAEAAASTARWTAGEPLGPLDGVPVAIKDEFHLAGYPTGAGSRTHDDARPEPADSTVAARLGAAGAVRFGKTQMHEIGLGGTGINPAFGTPRNPFAPDRIPGGSSSGSAVAVSSGIVPLALGSDAGGSIRIPAALCGVCGIKPTYGRVPATGGALLAWTLDHLGPLGATVADLAAFLEVTSGPDGHDPAAQGSPADLGAFAPMAPDDLAGKRFAYSPAWGMDGDPLVVALFQGLVSQMRDRGATVEPVALPWAEASQRVGYVTLIAEAAASQRAALERKRDAFGADVRLLLAVGQRVSAVEYLHAQRLRRTIGAELDALLGDYDALLTPTCGGLASPLRADAERSGEVDDAVNGPLSRYTFAGNLTGLPAATVPIGCVATEGAQLPVGCQLIGPAWQEMCLLGLAAAIEAMVTMPTPAAWFPSLPR